MGSHRLLTAFQGLRGFVASPESDRKKLEDQRRRLDRIHRISTWGIETLLPGSLREDLPGSFSFFDRVPPNVWQLPIIPALFYFLSNSGHWFPRATWTSLSLPAFLGLLHLLNAKFTKAPRSLQQLMDFPSEEQCPVQVRIFAGCWPFRKIVGVDYGIVTFTRDVLHFEGKKTAFDLPSRVVGFKSLMHKDSNGQAIDRKAEAYKFEWQVGNERGKVEFRVYKSVSGIRKDFRKAFLFGLDNWMAASARPLQTITLPHFRASKRRSEPHSHTDRFRDVLHVGGSHGEFPAHNIGRRQ